LIEFQGLISCTSVRICVFSRWLVLLRPLRGGGVGCRCSQSSHPRVAWSPSRESHVTCVRCLYC
jgi:hypothetical protein